MRHPAGVLLVVVFAGLATLSGCPSATTTSNTTSNNGSEEASHRLVEDLADSPSPHIVIHGATVMTGHSGVFSPGWLAMEGGRILGVGQGDPPASVLSGAEVVDATGHWVTPGLIDTHSHLGVYPSPRLRAHSDGNEMTKPVTPGVWAEHATWPQDPGFERALAGGVTSMMILPGSGNLIGGRGVTVHNHPRRGSRAMRFPGAPDALKMACGENPKRIYGEKKREPMTRMGNLRMQREAFAKARRTLSKGSTAVVGVDTNYDTLAGVLRGDILVHVHCYRADDMLNMLQLSDEFGFQIRSFHHATDAYKIRDVLAAHETAVSTWADWWGFKIEAFDAIEANAGLVHEAGGIAIIHSDSARGIQRLNQEAAKALRAAREAGVKLDESTALSWITINPAWALGIHEEVGSLEVGKRADVVVWDRPPLSVYANARWVYVDGHRRWSRDKGLAPWSDFELGWEVAP